jgi:hypothetical protein
MSRPTGKIATHTVWKRHQDPVQNLIEAATCRFRVGKTCLLVGSPDAYHCVPIEIDAQECRHCVETTVRYRSVYSDATERKTEQIWWKRWASSKHPHFGLHSLRNRLEVL